MSKSEAQEFIDKAAMFGSTPRVSGDWLVWEPPIPFSMVAYLASNKSLNDAVWELVNAQKA